MCSEEDYYEDDYPGNVVALEEEFPKNVSHFEEEYPKNVSQHYEGEGSFLSNISQGGVEEFMKWFMKYIKKEIILYFLNQTEMSTGFGGRDV